jgi:hypothetical protein
MASRTLLQKLPFFAPLREEPDFWSKTVFHVFHAL